MYGGTERWPSALWLGNLSSVSRLHINVKGERRSLKNYLSPDFQTLACVHTRAAHMHTHHVRNTMGDICSMETPSSDKTERAQFYT